MLEHQPSAANYDQSRVHVARRTSASHYWRKEILPHRRPVTFPFWIKDACEEERLQTFGQDYRDQRYVYLVIEDFKHLVCESDYVRCLSYML